jgi:hypothetical protein
LVIRFRRLLAMEAIMAAKDSVKKYVVRLGGEERQRLETLIRKGKGPARRVLKARILLKADISEAGPGWSDNKIIAALDTSASMVYRVRKQLATRQSTAAGSIWPSPNLAFYRPNASIAASPTNKPIAAWEHDRNANHAKADWHFTTANARIKLKHLYPSI